MRVERKDLQPGLSGIMRVKNEAQFIPLCIDSCIDALDELVIVYNDCTDDSEIIINTYQRRYPNKIRAFKYPYKVLSQGLSKEEFDYVMSLPEDSPALLCNYYNYALDKVQFTHALKIDADQVYFSKEISKWRNLSKQKCFDISFTEKVTGWLLFNLFRINRYLAVKLERYIRIPFQKAIKRHFNTYQKYVEYCFVTKDSCPSISGINLYKNNVCYVTLGHISERYNILPPFNGEGDHLIFRVGEDTYYKKFVFDFYNKLRSSRYSVIEVFQHPYTVMPYGFCWFHINSMREEYKEKNKLALKKNPSRYMELQSFLGLSYSDILNNTDNGIFSLYQRVLFQFLYENDKDTIKDNTSNVENISL